VNSIGKIHHLPVKDIIQVGVSMRNVQSPCAADALDGIKIITVNGRSVGIARPCDVIAAALSLHFSGDEEITHALL
jgi:hypothetical protein